MGMDMDTQAGAGYGLSVLRILGGRVTLIAQAIVPADSRLCAVNTLTRLLNFGVSPTGGITVLFASESSRVQAGDHIYDGRCMVRVIDAEAGSRDLIALSGES